MGVAAELDGVALLEGVATEELDGVATEELEGVAIELLEGVAEEVYVSCHVSKRNPT